jgi:hypothetical protein
MDDAAGCWPLEAEEAFWKKSLDPTPVIESSPPIPWLNAMVSAVPTSGRPVRQ